MVGGVPCVPRCVDRRDRASEATADPQATGSVRMKQVYMLDTDTVSFALRGVGKVGATLVTRAPSEVCISSVTLAELRYGAEHRQSKKLHALISAFTSSIAVMPFEEAAAAAFGTLAAELTRAGTP